MFQKFASATVLGVESRESGINKSAHRAVFDYVPQEGYIYVRSRAISSRCNDNFDYFGPEEIEKSYRTFIGKPVFVNHANDDHKRLRGVIIDAALHKDRNPDGSPDTWCEALMEVDALRFPKLALRLIKGEIDRTSMGCDVEFSKCSACGRVASSPSEYCQHIPQRKGQKIHRVDPRTGERTASLIFEECIGLKFFENSLLVEPPADPTAYFLDKPVLGPGLEHLSKAASRTASVRTVVPVTRPPLPPTRIWDLIKAAQLEDDEQEQLQSLAYKPDKPVSQMNPDEYAVHQGKVAEAKKEGETWNRRNPVKIKNIVEHWNLATDDEKSNGMRWYSDAHELSKHVAHDTGTDMHTMAGLMSNYSPQTHWATNIMNAARVARTKIPMGGPGEGIMATSKQKRAAGRMLSGEHYDKVLAGPKTRAFAHLIEHGGNADPEDPKVVIDRHALSVAAGARASDNAYSYSGLGGKGRYSQVSQAYHKAAKQISKQVGYQVHAHQVQAATWLARQRMNEAHDSQLTATATSRSAQNARGAVKEWNSYAAEHHPGAIGLEPGTGYANAPEDVQHASEMQSEGKTMTKAASLTQFLSYGETKAPHDVDTLRDEQCAICGNTTAYDGRQCQVCGYTAPPKALDDPDVDKAKALDALKQSIDDQRVEADPSMPGADVDAEDLTEAQGTGSDPGSPSLQCPVCQTTLTPGAPTTNATPPNAAGVPPQPPAGPAAGDPCPVCQQGELEPTGPSKDQEVNDDVNENGIPDEMEDANGDGVPDNEQDSDSDGIPDGEELDKDKDGVNDADEGTDDDAPDDVDAQDGNGPKKKKKPMLPAAKADRAQKYWNPHEGADVMRPALAAMQEQQRLIDEQQYTINRQSAQLRQHATQVAKQATQIQRLTAGLTAVAAHLGEEVVGQVKVAMIRKHADEQNPAQPVPEPAPEPASSSTAEAETPEVYADVNQPGLVPGSTNDVAANAVSTAYTPGMDIASPVVHNLMDVTRPIDGAQNPRPTSETITHPEIRVGNPMNPQTAFPLNGPFVQQQRTSAQAPQEPDATTMMAALRLARLQIQAGVADGEDIALAQHIASTSSLATITHDTETYSTMAKAASRQRQVTPPRGVAPRATGQQRTVPALGGTPALQRTAAAANGVDVDLEAIFVNLGA